MSVLELHDVSIRYITGDFKDIGLKEYVLRRLKNKYSVTEFWADRHISFSLEKGEMLGIIGTNGAGKSTLLKTIAGIMEPTEGWVKRSGEVAALLELGSGFDGDLTVKENAYLRGAMLGYTREFMDQTYDQILDFAELREFEHRPFKQLSSGMKSRLAFSIASLVKPDLLILDEVLAVGDGAFRKKSEAKMREIISGGAATILVSHSIGQIRQMCDKVLWLHKGEQIAFGDDVKGICDRYAAFLAGDESKLYEDGAEHKELVSVQKAESSPVKSPSNQSRSNIEAFLEKERVTEGKRPVRYVLEKHPKAEWLVVIFSGFAPRGARTQHPYNFTGALGDFPVHRLYVQDTYGERGVCYLCKDMDFGISEEVSALIKKVQKELSCGNDRTITLGSSKGGSAATYYALKHGFCHAIAIVPQFLIGTFLSSGDYLDSLEDMIGTGDREQKIERLNSLIFDSLNKNCDSKLHILTSEHDEQYIEQIVPFLNYLETNSLRNEHDITTDNRIRFHNDVMRFITEFVNEKLAQCVYGVNFDEKNGDLKCWQDQEQAATYQAEYVYYKLDGTQESLAITSDEQIISSDEILGGDILVRKDHKEVYRRRYCPWFHASVKAFCVETPKEWVITFTTPKNSKLPLEFACYIFGADNSRIHVERYSNNTTMVIPREGRFAKNAQCYWKYKDFRFSKMVKFFRPEQRVFAEELAYDIDVVDGVLHFGMKNLPKERDLQFSYYVLRNGEPIHKQMYTYATAMRFLVKESGQYAVKFFVLENGRVTNSTSSSVTVSV